MKICFLDTRKNQIFYDQGIKEFEKDLSIIDILMFNHKLRVKEFLKEYDLSG